jgi:hypothetical protein
MLLPDFIDACASKEYARVFAKYTEFKCGTAFTFCVAGSKLSQRVFNGVIT